MRVFLNYASSDQPLARKAARELSHAGLDVWWNAQVLPGDNWAEEHARALEASQAMVVLLSPASIQSQQVRADLSFALGKQYYKDRVVPVLVSSYDLLEYNDVPWVLKGMDTIELDSFSQPEDAFRQVAERLKHSLQATND